MEKTYTNPRTRLELDNWPYGRFDKVKAIFEVERGKKGERVSRVTQNPKTGGFNKPKKTTFSKRVVIVDGSDGKTYLAELSAYNHVTIRQSNMQYEEETIWPESDRFADIIKLFD